jgi:pimeloyl-ACP methyl ester carboxylesterase
LKLERKNWRLLSSLVVLASLAGGMISCRNPPPTPSANTVPIIFVHGIYGSGDQYRAMGLYFASNGYPAERIQAFDYASVANAAGAPALLDAFVDKVKAQFGVSKVHLVGHSLGTSVVSSYVNSHAAKVDKYVLVDGFTCGGSSGRPCLAISEFSLPAVGGGTQTHVESSVSPESFAKQYQFFLGKAPTTTKVVPEPAGPIKLAGRVQEFTANSPVGNAPVNAWEVDPATGAHVSASPAATTTTGSDGFFGLTVTQGKSYDIAVDRQAAGVFHCYFQPFVRSDLLLRLNTIGPNSAGSKNSNRSATSADVTVVRNREFWRAKGAQNDGLTIATTTPDGRSQPAVDVFKNVTSGVVGVWVQDNAATPGVSSLSTLPYFSSQPFQTGVDVFMPAASPPNGTISIVNTPRGDASKKQTLNVANWASSTDAVLAEFNDWVQ